MLMPQIDHAAEGFATLDRALDPQFAGQALARSLAQAGFAARSLEARVERVRLKPGRKALIGYRLHGSDAAGNPFDQHLMLTLWPGGDPAMLHDMGITAAATPGFGPPRMAVTELGGEAWLFPNDRKIAGINHLLEQAHALGPVMEVIHYVPEQGCTLRVTGDGGTFYGKVRADDRGVTASRVAELGAGHGVRLAQVIHSDAALRIQWQLAVAGDPLDVGMVLAEPVVWAERIGAGLRAFQAMTVPPGLPVIEPALLARTVTRRIARIVGTLPEHAAQLSSMAARLERFSDFTPVLALSHGDLHPANLLWDGASFALIDLDTCALAPPARDYASLTAALATKAAGLGLAPQAMVGALADASGVPAGEFHWCLAASLLGERLYRSATRLKSTNHAALIALAEASLQTCELHHA
jgi:hypothetical protein